MKKGFLLSEPSKPSSRWGGGGATSSGGGWGPPRQSWSKPKMGLLRDARSNPCPWGSAASRPKKKEQAATQVKVEAPSLKGLSFMPKTAGVPKVPLGKWYSQKRSIELKKEQFLVWHDDGPSHKRGFTCVFVCPLTGEVWPSGRFGSDPKIFAVRRDESTRADVVWYTSKKLAEHGAAARAHDCLTSREAAGTTKLPTLLGQDEPYLVEEDAPPLPTIPPAIEAKIQELKQAALERMQVEPEQPPDIDIEEEAQRYREQYRAERYMNETKTDEMDM